MARRKFSGTPFSVASSLVGKTLILVRNGMNPFKFRTRSFRKEDGVYKLTVTNDRTGIFFKTFYVENGIYIIESVEQIGDQAEVVMRQLASLEGFTYLDTHTSKSVDPHPLSVEEKVADLNGIKVPAVVATDYRVGEKRLVVDRLEYVVLRSIVRKSKELVYLCLGKDFFLESNDEPLNECKNWYKLVDS